MGPRLRVFLSAVALFMGFLPHAALSQELPAPNRETVRLTTEMLKEDSQLAPFRTEQFFKMVLAHYKQNISDVQKDATLTPEQKKAKTDKLVAQAYELLVLYDQVQNVAPVAFAITVHFFGLEVPIPFYNMIPRLGQYSTLALQASIGVTLAVAQNPVSNKKEWALGLSTLTGANVTFTKQVDKMDGAKFFGVSVFIPAGSATTIRKMGDLQRWYHGIAAEMSLDIGTRLVGARTYQIGAYTNTSLDTLMIFFFGSTAQDRKFALQYEALAFTTLYGHDGSSPRSPIPFTSNFSTSEHSPARRAEMEAARRALPTESQMKDAIKRAQERLENVR